MQTNLDFYFIHSIRSDIVGFCTTRIQEKCQADVEQLVLIWVQPILQVDEQKYNDRFSFFLFLPNSVLVFATTEKSK